MLAFCTTLLKTVRVETGNVFRMKDFQRTSFRHFRALVKRQKRRLSTVGCLKEKNWIITLSL